jgi:CheY-like chemotaxis protein
MDILRSKIILVAAADVGSREAVAEEFRGHGCVVHPVTGGIEAYELARERHVDAVLTACRLTSGDPALLLSDVRRLNHDIPVILFGAAGESLTQSEAIHRGFAAYFLQSFPTAPLAAAAARSLEFVDERKKKKVERVSVAAEVELSFGDPPQTVTVQAPVLNISRGGMFLSMERNFPPMHSYVNFGLTLPADANHPRIDGRAFVRWVRERPGSGHLPGVGIEFTELETEARDFLDRYVSLQSRSKRT